MKKYLLGIFFCLILILSYKTDSFADGNTNTFYIDGRRTTEVHIRYNFNGVVGERYCVVITHRSDQAYPWDRDNYTVYSSSNTGITGNMINLSNGSTTSMNFGFSFADAGFYSCTTSFEALGDLTSTIPLFESVSAARSYIYDGDISDAVNKESLPFDSVSGSSDIPTPVCNWVLNEDGSLSRTLQFTNAQLPQNPNIRMGLQLIVHWASVDNITMSYSNQSANFLGTGYSVFYDNALSQEGVPMGYPLPSSVSDMKPCPSQIDFLTDSNSIALFNSFLSSHPVSERSISYSPGGISSFADSFRSHLGDIDFPYNVPYVSARYYYKSPDGSDLRYGGWTSTYPKLPAQGAVLSINKQTGEITVPFNEGTFNQGTDIDGNPIFDNGTTIVGPDMVNFDDLNNSVESLFSYIGQFPSFLSRLFPFLPSWVPVFLASIIGITLVVGIVRIILK